MARRSILTFFLTAIVFLLLGATGVYLALSIPNDIRAEALLIAARSDLQSGKRDEAREKFETVVKNYPRTDAAAAASFALFRLLDQDRKELAEALAKVERQRAAVQRQVGELDRRVGEASRQAGEALVKASTPPPPPKPTVTRRPTSKRTATAPRRRRS